MLRAAVLAALLPELPEERRPRWLRRDGCSSRHVPLAVEVGVLDLHGSDLLVDFAQRCLKGLEHLAVLALQSLPDLPSLHARRSCHQSRVWRPRSGLRLHGQLEGDNFVAQLVEDLLRLLLNLLEPLEMPRIVLENLPVEFL